MQRRSRTSQRRNSVLKQPNIGSPMKWFSMDLHLHTPASSDYQDPGISYLDILRRAETRGLDIIGFADHNTVAGYRKMQDEIDQLKLLRSLDRILPEEEQRLKEYERLRAKIMVLPGFEFTATFGFHVMGVFAPDKPLRELEHILLDLNVPADQLEVGSVTVGASSDVLTAYEAIHDAGGIVIAAHANSSAGVAMRGFNFGGQTKIAYTQDPHLHALEITDLEKRGRFTTAAFFSGTKPEYPRRMHTIQGSDAHRLDNDPRRHNNLGVGGRVTEVLLPEVTFPALKELFESNDFARTRPRQARRKADEKAPDFDFVRSARDEGSNIVQSFHENLRATNLEAVINDVCGFANTNGGTLFIGLNEDPMRPIPGIKNPNQVVRQLQQEIAKRISPPLQCAVDLQQTGGKSIIRVLVPRGPELPYAVDNSKIYIRTEGETGLAVRDEIVRLIAKRQEPEPAAPVVEETPAPRRGRGRGRGSQQAQQEQAKPARKQRSGRQPKQQKPAEQAAKPPKPEVRAKAEEAPRTGVEIVSVEEREGIPYYIVRDLRNGMVVNNVTEKSARKLWHYAIKEYAALPREQSQMQIAWRGDFGLLKQYSQHKQTRYDFVQRVDGEQRFYFGVTEDGVHGDWRQLLPVSEQEPETSDVE